nr:hypothetical protein Itr_chr03CG08110 [Ipomoea trifida]
MARMVSVLTALGEAPGCWAWAIPPGPESMSAVKRVRVGTGMAMGGHNTGGYAATMDNLRLGPHRVHGVQIGYLSFALMIYGDLMDDIDRLLRRWFDGVCPLRPRVGV